MAWWSTLTGLCAVLLFPLLLTDVPPLLDYPNHLARLYALAFLPADPVLARFYQARWGIIPNLALDLTVPPLIKIFPVHVVGRAVAGLVLVLPVLGAAAYHRALTGRLSYWPFASVLVAYNAAMLRGFLNFIASIGIALLLGAAWVAWRDRRPSLAIAIAAAGAVALFFCHLTGLLFFAILIGGHGVASVWSGPLRVGWTLKRIAVVIAIFIAPALLYVASDLGQLQGDAAFRSPLDKADAALTPMLNYFLPLDIATALFCIAVPILCLVRRWCTVPSQAALAITVLLAFFIALPTAFKGTFDLDTRFIVMAAFLVPAALVPVALPRRAALVLATGGLLLFGVRMAILSSVWNDWDADIASFRRVIASVQPGDVVLSARLPRGGEPNIWTTIATARRLSDGTVVDSHTPALLLIEHQAWWPFMFDSPSQQPIETHEPYRTMAARIDKSPDPIGLPAADPSGMRLITHVLVRGPAPGPSVIASDGLKFLAGNADVALYEVVRDATNRPALLSPLSGR